ncbi:MAG: TonB-dependent receptor [Bacteroidota bacterium]
MRSIFKLILFYGLIFFQIYTATAQQTPLLNRPVSVSFEKEPMIEVLARLEEEVDGRISYSPNALDEEVLVSGSFVDVPLREILDELLVGYVTTYREQGRLISIKARRNARSGNSASGTSSDVRTSRVSGTVTDQSDQPVPFAAVVLKGTTIGTQTDPAGNFLLNNIPIGSQPLQVSSTGFKTQEVTVVVSTNQTVAINITLEESVNQLEEVVIVGETEKKRLERTARAVTVIETKEAKQRTADLGEVLARTEGVVVRRTGGLGSATQFALNGLQGEQVRFFLDGIPGNFLGIVNGIANVPVNLVDRVEIYKGVVPVQFGADALGGAVNLVSRQSSQGNGANISYQYGSFNTHRATLNYRYQGDSSNLFIHGSGFYDFTNNNYEVDVEITNDQGRLEPTTAERFHDDYQALGTYLEVGAENLNWADLVSVTGFYSQYARDIQNNAFMTIPFGDATTEESIYGGVIKWEKDWDSGFSAELNTGYSYNLTSLLDTSACRYNWLGECVFRGSSQGEFEDFPFHQNLWDNNYFLRSVANYKFKSGHVLRIANAPTLVERSGRNLLITDPDTPDILQGTNRVFSYVSGIEYEWKSKDSNTELLSFVKYYLQDIESMGVGFFGNIINRDTNADFLGFGVSTRKPINDRLAVKVSYERAIRLPTAREIFGNGAQIRPNLELEPERSHNANLGLNYQSLSISKNSWGIGVNGFLRAPDNLIQLLGFENFLVFRNVFSAVSTGVEVVGRWTSADGKLNISGNSTWQDFRNRSSEGAFVLFDGDRIPNQPYLFANGSVSYRISDLMQINDRLTFFWGGRYVHEFFRTWESIQADNKVTIPSQFVQNVGFTYGLPVRSNNISFTAESQNITDTNVFDLFGVQRPGRAFFIKLNIRI